MQSRLGERRIAAHVEAKIECGSDRCPESATDHDRAAKFGVEANKDDGVTNGITTILTLDHTTSGTPAAGIGAGAAFRAELSDNISLEVYNFITDKQQVSRYSIDKIPATVIEGESDYGIRFFGVPSGFEFGTLIESIVMASKGDSGLKPETREALAQLAEPVHLQVFVTPT